MKTNTLKSNIVRQLLLVTLGLAISGSAAHAQPLAETVPVGFFITHTSEIPYAIAVSLGNRATENNLESVIGVRSTSEFTPLLRDMTMQLLAAEPTATAIPQTQAELWSLSSGVAQELILELIKVRTTGGSAYLKPAIVTLLRDPAMNHNLVAVLVRSLR